MRKPCSREITISGTVTSVSRRRSLNGTFVAVYVDHRRVGFKDEGQQIPARGTHVTITGAPVVAGGEINMGNVAIREAV